MTEESKTTLEQRVDQIEKNLNALLRQTINLTVEYNKTLDTISSIQSCISKMQGRPL